MGLTMSTPTPNAAELSTSLYLHGPTAQSVHQAITLLRAQAARIAELEHERDVWQERAEFMTAMARDAQDARSTLQATIATANSRNV